jgi:hypothetical protein
MAGQRKKQKRNARQAGKLYMYGLWLRGEERTRNPLLSHALPEVRRADGPQIRKRGMTTTQEYEY